MAGQKTEQAQRSGCSEEELKGAHTLEYFEELPTEADSRLLRDLELWGLQDVIEAMEWCEERLVYCGEPLNEESLEKVWYLRMLRRLFSKVAEQAHLRRKALAVIPAAS